MAKTMDDLAISREIRAKVIQKYGDVPTSVWEIDYSEGRDVIEYEKRKQQAVAIEKHKKMDYDKNKLGKAFEMSSQNVRGKSGGLSTFPPGLCRRIVMFYSEEGETVLDPCAGHNSRMQVTYNLGRNYIGYDVSQEFIQFNKEVKDEITGAGVQGQMFAPSNTITLHEQSSEKMVEEDNSIDLVFTSPPYWDIEYYGEESEQLGFGKDYGSFLQGLRSVISESYRVLKPDRYCAFNINDFRKNGNFYSYHADVIKLFEDVGFKMWDVIIIKWKSSIGSCFASQVESRKITAKAHEYLVVGKKVLDA